MNPKVSIIIPCYNQAKFLPKAIDSLKEQSLTNWECIVVDDGSTDNSAEVVANIALKDPRIRLIQQLNGGSASARNRALQEIKGEFIQFLDADDYIDSMKLKKQVELMESQRLDISYTAYRNSYSDNKLSEMRCAKLTPVTVLTNWGLGSSMPLHAFLYRTQFIKDHNIRYDNNFRYREDWNWLIHCFHEHARIVAIPDYCGAYYHHTDTGKTSSYIKMQSGNFAFMAYLAPRIHGWNKLLWTYRVSEEVWIWLLRMMKYRSAESANTISYMNSQKGLLICAILLMPISILSVLRYFIKTYLVR